MFELARLALSASVAAILQATVLVPAAAAAPVATLGLNSTEFLREASPSSADQVPTYSNNLALSEYPTADVPVEPSVHDFPAARAVGHVFQSREFELNVLDDKYKPFSAPGSCFYPDTTLRGFGESAEDCRFIKPGEENRISLICPSSRYPVGLSSF